MYRIWILVVTGVVFFSFQKYGQHTEIVLSPGVEKASEVFMQLKKERPYFRGWRIVVSITRERRELDRMERRFKGLFPEREVEWVFHDPFFRILSGTYFNRWDAMEDLTEIRKEFPGAFEMNTNIPYTRFIEHLKSSTYDPEK